MYVTTNFKTKKALKEAVNSGDKITIFQPGPFGGKEPTDGIVAVEGLIIQNHIHGMLKLLLKME